MENTTENKLTLLLNTKQQIAEAIEIQGVHVPENTPFSVYPSLIIAITEETAAINIIDLMLICDMEQEIYEGTYIEPNYNNSDIAAINNLINKILEGV